MKSKLNLLLFVLLFTHTLFAQSNKEKPVKIAVAGMTHGHVDWILGSEHMGKHFELVGLAEPNKDLAMRLIKRYQLDESLWYSSLDDMLQDKDPEAVCAFGSIYEHLEVVEKCAPKGIHVMVEKPLAVNNQHAEKMFKLATDNDIHLLTNYETTWYPSNHKIHALHSQNTIGSIRKMVIHDGHQGPIEIGCSKEFLQWLTDPVQNGGGAVIDFGCYGANLATWLMNNERPKSVTAILQQLKPAKYPNVDDEATIIVEYEGAQAIIQASWNWPYSRKDIEVYGVDAALFAASRNKLTQRKPREEEKDIELEPLSAPINDPFVYLSAVIRGEIDPAGDLSSLKNNMIVVEILSAAIESSKSKKTVFLKK